VVDGLTMFIAQAAAQFELWTGILPDTQKMRHTILTHPDFQTQ
jgi:shikimate dehydrogenase